MNITFEHTGKVTAGYYNEMEAGHPFFVDGEPLSELVKDWLQELGYDPDVCYGPFQNSEHVKNKLVGCNVKITLELQDVSAPNNACTNLVSRSHQSK